MTPLPPRIVMISSTAQDLPAHRDKVRDACIKQNCLPKMMEHMPAANADALAESLKMVDQAHVYLGLFAHRYGYAPDASGVSITQREYERAVARGIPRLIFLMHEDHPIKVSDIEKGSGAKRLERLKGQLRRERVVNFFRSPEELHGQVLGSLGELLKDLDIQAEAGVLVPPAARAPATAGGGVSLEVS